MRCALKGRQIERPNKGEVRSMVQLSQVSISPFPRATIGANPSGSRIFRPLQGEPFILRIPRVETLG